MVVFQQLFRVVASRASREYRGLSVFRGGGLFFAAFQTEIHFEVLRREQRHNGSSDPKV